MRLPFWLAAALVMAAPATAFADTFTLLIYETPAELALRTDPGDAGKAYWTAYATYGETLAKAGAIRGGAALAAPAKPDGLTLGGYFTIEAPTRAAAEALAVQAPAIRRGGRVELRANLPAMAPKN